LLHIHHPAVALSLQPTSAAGKAPTVCALHTATDPMLAVPVTLPFHIWPNAIPLLLCWCAADPAVVAAASLTTCMCSQGSSASTVEPPWCQALATA
jgi:hypothetical protein